MMWEGGNASMASFHAMMHGIHVLLVDHDAQALMTTANQLEMCQYRVTFVELASAGISMLLSGKARFDVVMANINSPDLHGLKLLQHSVNLCIPVVLMSEDDNAFIAMRALEDGAFLYIKKPLPMEFLRCLWQHVVREKTRMVRERDMYVASNNLGPIPQYPNPPPNMTIVKNKSKSRGRNYDYIEEYGLESPMMMKQKGNVRRKMCTEWTQELHAKFINAVEQLGEGRCFPKDILEVMNEPGLTRMQVASHLQKCRNDNWRSPEERKASHQTTPPDASQHKPRRFGSKPRSLSGKNQINTQETGQSSDTRLPNDHQYLSLNHGMTHDSSGRAQSDGQQKASSEAKRRWSSDTSNLDSDSC